MGETKVFVGNVSFKASKDELTAFFGDCRAIREVAIIVDRDTRRSKGYAFIIFTDENAARDAVARMDGQDFQGRPLKVRVADNQDNNRSFKDLDSRREPPQGYDQGGYGDMHQGYPHAGNYGASDGYGRPGYGNTRGGYNDYNYGSGDYYNDYYRRNEGRGYSNGHNNYYNY